MLHVHRAERADRLAEALADVLVDPLDDPFTPEVVAVPTRGVERWLAHRLSHRLGTTRGADGVCANVAFPSPAELVDTALGAAADHPWGRDRLVWPLLEVIDDCAGESWCPALTAYVRSERPGRRHAAAHHLAALFTRYAEHRPSLVRAWAAKDDTGVDDDLRWQAELWRRVRDRVGVPCPAEDLPAACAHLSSADASLPARISLFGPTRLSATHLEVIAAIARARDVHLWLPHPSPALWDATAATRTAATEPPRRADVPDVDVAHPLLASLARDVRELQVRLAALDVPARHHHHDTERPPPVTLLAGLQDDLRRDRAPAERAPDETLTVHACHGPDRQVEVLREVVLARLAADPTLEPRDVVVLCPDIETYAPLITAAFGAGSGDGLDHPGHRLAVRLADRSLRQVNPLLGTVATLLELADARVTASQLLDLAESAPVARRFGFDADDLARLRELVAAAGVRWGLDAEHRAPFKLDGFPQNTWSTGLDRLLLGAAMSEDGHRWLGTALPLDDVDSDAVDLVGRFAELVDRVHAVLDRLTGRRPLGEWVDALLAGLDLLAATTPSEAWQLTQARAELTGIARAGDGHGSGGLDLADVRGVLAEALAGRPTRANFRTGTLTVATLLPMRSVPHRVICLLGLDDGVFPREGGEDGDDVLARDPRVGERDPRSEDRQMLLDALTAATEHLVVIHSGADERTNARREPAVPLGELLDVVGAGVVVRHPLQPFDARDFADDHPFSFDAAARDGARRLAGGRRESPAPFLDGPLAPVDEPLVALDDLVRFVEHPVKAFLSQRLGLHPPADDEEPDDALPVDLDGLARWQIGDRLLTDRLAGADPDACRQAEWRRGALPPGSLGQAVLADLQRRVEALVAVGAPLRAGPVRPVDTEVALDGARVVGTVPEVRDDTLVTVTYSTLAAKHRLAAWVRLLALTAGDPSRPWRAVTVGRWGGSALRSTLGPVDPTVARGALADLVALRADGLRAPLPLLTKASCAYAEARARGAEDDAAREKAADEWAGRFPERADPAYARVGWTGELGALDGQRFAELAQRVWAPLLGAERKDRP